MPATKRLVRTVIKKPLPQPTHLSQPTRVNDLWAQLIAFQKQVHGKTWPKDPDAMTQQYIMLLVKEAMEVLDHTSFKPHKPRIDYHARDAERKEEIADVVIFALELAAVSFGSFDELLAEMERKSGINNTRLAAVETQAKTAHA